jgi:hypothetical protein
MIREKAGWKYALAVIGFCSLSFPTFAATTYLSYTGTLADPTSVFELTFTLTAADTINIQTWGFGGGTNAAGQPITAGGFDPLVALFSGPISTATIVVDGSSNPFADADTISGTPYTFVGNCPPAGTVTIGGPVCGDDFMQVPNLPAGVYTLVLTDAGYVPNAVFDNGALSEGFANVGAAFQTCNVLPTGTTCATDTGNYAVDIASATGAASLDAPEPGTMGLLGGSFAVLFVFKNLLTRARVCAREV